jgi:hypothetical protein
MPVIDKPLAIPSNVSSNCTEIPTATPAIIALHRIDDNNGRLNWVSDDVALRVLADLAVSIWIVLMGSSPGCHDVTAWST